MEANFKYQKVLLDMFTDQLVAHGAYLFASLSAAIGFLRFLERAREPLKSMWCSKIAAGAVLAFLFTLAVYTLLRLLYWAQLANYSINVEVPNDIGGFYKYYLHVVGTAKNNMNRLTFILTQPNSIRRRGLLSLSIGVVLSLFFSLPLLQF